MKKQEQQRNDEEKQALNATISGQVIDILGQPGDLHCVQVRHLWTDHFRVNVLIGPDAASSKVAHSFFLMVGDKGNILTSTPKITRRY